MDPRLGWKLMFRVKDRKKAENRLQHAQQLLGRELRLASCEQYWKIPELWTCDATTRLDGQTASEQVLDCLLQANRLATGWYTLGLNLTPDQRLESFSGIFSLRHGSNTRLSCLEWAAFDSRTMPGGD